MRRRLLPGGAVVSCSHELWMPPTAHAELQCELRTTRRRGRLHMQFSWRGPIANQCGELDSAGHVGICSGAVDDVFDAVSERCRGKRIENYMYLARRLGIYYWMIIWRLFTMILGSDMVKGWRRGFGNENKHGGIEMSSRDTFTGSLYRRRVQY